MHMNLPEPFDTYNYVISARNDIPSQGGLLFPYLEQLARDDHTTIPSLFSVQLLGLLGDTEEVATGVYSSLTSAWAQMKITTWGKELSHMFTGLRLAYETGAGYRAMVSPQGEYSGFILLGGFFSVYRDGIEFRSGTSANLQAAYVTATPHLQSLETVYRLLNFQDDMARNTARAEARSLYSVAKDVRAVGYNVNNLPALKAALIHVSFAQDRYLSINASNIVRVLRIMHDGIGEEQLPLHHTAVFEQSQHRRILSAFGSTAPSFRIEGGRLAPLTGSFSFTKKTGKGKMEQMMTTMYAAVRPLADAWVDLEMVLSTKDLLTAAGTPLASRASAKSLIRSYEGANGVAVLAALRTLAGVAMNAEASGSKRKREADDESGAGAAKKRALDIY